MQDNSDPIQVRTEEIRCTGIRRYGEMCGKLLTRISLFISVPDSLKKTMEDKPIFKLVEGLEIKIGLETKCTRCKKMDYKLAVL